MSSVSRCEQRVYKHVRCTQVVDSEQTQGRGLKSCRCVCHKPPQHLGNGGVSRSLSGWCWLTLAASLGHGSVSDTEDSRNAPFFDRICGNMASKVLGTNGVFLCRSVRTEPDIFSVGEGPLGWRSDLSDCQMVTQLDKLPLTECYFLNYPQLGEASS